MPISIVLGDVRIVCDSYCTSGHFAFEGEACLNSEMFRRNSQLDKFFVALCLVSLYEVLNLHRRDGNSFLYGKRVAQLAKPDGIALIENWPTVCPGQKALSRCNANQSGDAYNGPSQTLLLPSDTIARVIEVP